MMRGRTGNVKGELASSLAQANPDDITNPWVHLQTRQSECGNIRLHYNFGNTP